MRVFFIWISFIVFLTIIAGCVIVTLEMRGVLPLGFYL